MNTSHEIFKLMRELEAEAIAKFHYYVKEVFNIEEELPSVTMVVTGAKNDESCDFDLYLGEYKILTASAFTETHPNGNFTIDYVDIYEDGSIIPPHDFTERAALILTMSYLESKGKTIECAVAYFLEMHLDEWDNPSFTINEEDCMRVRFVADDSIYHISLCISRSDNNFVLQGRRFCDRGIKASGLVVYNTFNNKEELYAMSTEEVSSYIEALYGMAKHLVCK